MINVEEWIEREKKICLRDEKKSGMTYWGKFDADNHDFKEYELNWRETKKLQNATGKYITKASDEMLTFDIEVTSAFRDKRTGLIQCYSPERIYMMINNKLCFRKAACGGLSEEYWNNCDALAVPYQWQFEVGETVYFGRDLRSVKLFLDKLPTDLHIVVFIHNLSYEFKFLSNILSWRSVFARDISSIMKCISEEHKNIEFRCSYMLTTLSLEAWGKDLGCYKLKGDLDYNKMRTPWTDLTEEEYGYCKRDCEVVYNGIKKYIEQYGHISNIPLTRTGEVRLIFKDIAKNNDYIKRFYQNLVPDPSTYVELKWAFAGGYTHGNELYCNCNVYLQRDENKTVNKLKHEADIYIETLGYHYDKCSMYPYEMISQKFPATPFKECEFDERLVEDYAFIMRVRFTKAVAKGCWHYISLDKCFHPKSDIYLTKPAPVLGMTLDNGRVVDNKGITFDMIITEQDLSIIKDLYDIEYEVVSCKKSRKAYLPKEYILAILELYGNKTKYKGVEGKEEIYAQSKRHVNGVYGCFVMRLVDGEVIFDGDKISKEKVYYWDIEDKISELRGKSKYGVWNSYAQGVWIPAYARRDLFDAILLDPKSVMYCDTDSMFSIKKIDLAEYNSKVIERTKKMCDFYVIDYSLTCPRTREGVEKPLGVMELEDTFTEFKCTRAKSYVYRPAEGKNAGKLVSTVSGVSKSAVTILDNDIKNFTNKTEFHRDHPDMNRMMVKYCEDMDEVVYCEGEYDEYKSTFKRGINMRPTGYNMDLSKFLNYLDNVPVYVDELFAL